MGDPLVEPGRPGYELTAPRVAETPALLRFGSINFGCLRGHACVTGPTSSICFCGSGSGCGCSAGLLPLRLTRNNERKAWPLISVSYHLEIIK